MWRTCIRGTVDDEKEKDYTSEKAVSSFVRGFDRDLICVSIDACRISHPERALVAIKTYEFTKCLAKRAICSDTCTFT